jgi:hypothetical protein
MSRMRRLEPGDKVTKLRFVKPVGNEPPQAALALGNVIMTVAMQRMAGIGGCSLSSHYEDQAVSPAAGFHEEALELPPGFFCRRAVKIELRFIGYEAAGELLGGSPIKPGQRGRLCC